MKNLKAIVWIKKAKSSLEKVIKMIEEDKYCIDIIQQNLAVIWLLKSANLNLLESHMHCCVSNAFLSKDKEEIDKKLEELLKIIKVAQDK